MPDKTIKLTVHADPALHAALVRLAANKTIEAGHRVSVHRLIVDTLRLLVGSEDLDRVAARAAPSPGPHA